jgi:hypothetical protein
MITDSTSTINSTIAASATAVKSAFDNGSNAILNANSRVLKAGDTMTGNLIVNANIGINTALPLQPLHVQGLAYITSNLGVGLAGSNAFQPLTVYGQAYISSNVGIGTTFAKKTLDVQGDINFAGSLYQNNNLYISSQWSSNNTTNSLYYNGNVGIGSTQPRNALDVVGSIYGTNLAINNSIITSNLTVLGTQTIVNTYTTYSSNLVIDNQLGTGPALLVLQKGLGQQYAIADFYDRDVSTTVPALRVADGGYIGIGTATPQQKLHVQGLAYITSNLGIGLAGSNAFQPLTVYGQAYISSNVGIGTTQPLAALDVAGTIRGSALTGALITDSTSTINSTIAASATAVKSAFDNGSNAILNANSRVLKAGDTMTGNLIVNANIGINTAIPLQPLTVYGQAYISSNVGIGLAGSNAFQPLTVYGQAYISSNVGIGTTQPLAALDVAGTIRGSALTGALITDSTSTINSTIAASATAVKSAFDNGSNAILNANSRVLKAGDTMTGNLIVNANIGINTMTPLQPLHVQGLAYITSNVGIGTTFAKKTLDIQGDINFAGSLYQNNNLYISSQWTSNNATNSLYYNGSVGIGSTQPTVALDVVGSIRGTNLAINNTITTSNLTVLGTQTIVNTYTTYTSNLTIDNQLGTGPALLVLQKGVGNQYPIADFYDRDVSTTIPALRVADGGNVGIGTTLAKKTLDVQGDINFAGSLYQNNSLYISSQWTSNTSINSLYYNGSVGIGTTNPTHDLHIYSTSAIDNDYESAGILLENATIGEVGIALRNANVGTNTWVMGINSNNTRFDITYGTQTAQLNNSDVKLSLDTSGTLTTSNLVILNQLALGPGALNTNIQVKPTRQTFYVSNSTQSSFNISLNGLYGGEASNVQVYLGQKLLTYYTSNYKDYDVSLNYPTNSNITNYNINLTTPAIYGDFVDITIWPQLISSSPLTGSVYQNFNNITQIVDGYIKGGSYNNIYTYSNFGIGTVTPLQPLHVQGLVYISSNVGIGTTFAKKTLDVEGDINFAGSLYQNNNLYISSQWTSNASINSLYYNGSVGIGTTNPTHDLHIYSTSSTDNDYESAGILLHNATAGEVGIAFRNSNLGQNAWVMGLNSNSTRFDIAYGVQTSQLNMNDVKLSLDTSGTLTTSNLVVLGQVALAPGALNTNIQVKPTRQTFYVNTSTQSTFTLLVNGLYGGEASNVQVYLGQKILTYYNSTYKDYTLSVYYPTSTTTQYTITLTTPAVYGNFVDITVWPQLLSTSISSGSVYQNITLSNLPTYITNNYSTLFTEGSIGNIYTTSNVGIGTAIPLQPLHVQGQSYFTSNIGIGTNRPNNELHITSTTPTIFLDGGSAGTNMLINDTSYLRIGTSSQFKPHIQVVGNSFASLAGRVQIRYKNYVTFDLVDGVSTSTERVRIDTNGNVGIGTNNPLQPLHVQGQANITGQIISTLATGTAPFNVSSTTLVTNLNAGLLNSQNAAYYLDTTNHTNRTQICRILPSTFTNTTNSVATFMSYSMSSNMVTAFTLDILWNQSATTPTSQFTIGNSGAVATFQNAFLHTYYGADLVYSANLTTTFGTLVSLLGTTPGAGTTYHTIVTGWMENTTGTSTSILFRAKSGAVTSTLSITKGLLNVYRDVGDTGF